MFQFYEVTEDAFQRSSKSFCEVIVSCFLQYDQILFDGFVTISCDFGWKSRKPAKVGNKESQFSSSSVFTICILLGID